MLSEEEELDLLLLLLLETDELELSLSLWEDDRLGFLVLQPPLLLLRLDAPDQLAERLELPRERFLDS